MSYSTLQANIADYMHRDDLSAIIPTFIKSAEAEFNNKLRVRSMETSFAEIALTDGATALPSDFEAWKVVWTTTNGNRTLKVTTNEYIRSREANANKPSYFALEGSNMICYPTAGSVAGIYYQTIPDLQTNTDNWLETERPDLYLFECLRHASIYTKNKEAAEAYNSLSKGIVDELNSASMAEAISGSPLTARVR